MAHQVTPGAVATRQPAQRTTFVHHTIPVINQRSVNSTTANLGGFHISYNASRADYGCNTTAIVLKGRVFFVLNGDHRDALAEAAESGGVQCVINYFIRHIAQANAISEHHIVIGDMKDFFAVTETAVEVIGQASIDRIAQATRAAGR